MKIAELFTEIQLDGADSVGKDLQKIKKGTVAVGGAILGTVAAIAGMTWAMKKLGAASNAEGTALKNFGLLTGIASKELQQYQYAARKAGATNEEMSQSFKALQDNMFQAEHIKGGAPMGLAWIISKVGKPQGGLKNTLGMMEKLNEFAQKNKDKPVLVAQALKSMGLSENIIAGMMDGLFAPEILKQAPYYTDRQIKKLDSMRDSWQQIGDQIERGIGKINIDHFSKMLPEIKELVSEVLKLVEAMSEFMLKVDAFGKLAKTFGWMSDAMVGMSENTQGVISSSNQPKNITKGETFLQTLIPGKWPTSSKITTNNAEVNINIEDANLSPNDVGRAAGNAISDSFKNITREAN